MNTFLLVSFNQLRLLKMQNKLAPSSRKGHTTINTGKSILVFGGKNIEKSQQLYEYSFLTRLWKPIHFSPPYPPSGLYDHVAIYKHPYMYVFGGKYKKKYTNSLWRFNTRSSEWQLLESTGKKPSPRSSQSAVLYKNKIIVFGGKDKESRYNSMYKLDLDSLEWKRIRYKNEGPSARNRHGAVLKDTEMYIFGGIVDDEWKQDLWKFDLKSKIWTKLADELPTNKEQKYRLFIYEDFIFAISKTSFKFNLILQKWQNVDYKLKYSPYNEFLILNNDSIEIHLSGTKKVSNLNLTKTFVLSRIAKLQNDKKFSNITIQTESTTFQVHDFIISQSSKLIPDEENTIALQDIKDDVFEIIHKYLYTANLQVSSWEQLVNVEAAASKLGLYRLRDLCQQKFSNFVDTKNVVQIYKKARELQLNDLKSLCYHFIQSNKNVFIKDMSPFEALSKAEMIELIKRGNGDIQFGREIHQYFGVPEDLLYNHIMSVYLENAYADLTLQAELDGKEFKVNKALLCAFSEFFNGMFTSSMQETSQDTVMIEGLNGKILKVILDFIFTRKVELPREPAELKKIISCADMFMLEGLRNMATIAFCATLSPFDVMDVFGN